jgi:hypothetical protein
MGGQRDGIRGPYSAWDWTAPTIRLPGKSDSPKHIVAGHASDCAVNNGPAYPPGPCNCGAVLAIGPTYRFTETVGAESRPSPAAIAAFLDVVRRLNNSVDFGEVEPAAGVWRWLETLAHE